MRKWMTIRECLGELIPFGGLLYEDEDAAAAAAAYDRSIGVIVHVAQVEYGEPVEERREHEIVRAAREYVRLAIAHGWSEPHSVEERRCWDALVKSVEGK